VLYGHCFTLCCNWITSMLQFSWLIPYISNPCGWIFTTLKTAKQKCKALTKYKVTKQQSDYVTYTKCRNRSTIAVRDTKYMFERNLVLMSNLTNLFWLEIVLRYEAMLMHLYVMLDPSLKLTCQRKWWNAIYILTSLVAAARTNYPQNLGICRTRVLMECHQTLFSCLYTKECYWVVFEY